MRAKNARQNIIRGIYAYKPTGKNTQADGVAAVMREICEHHTDLFKQFTNHNSNEVLEPLLRAVKVKMDHKQVVTNYVVDLLSLMKTGLYFNKRSPTTEALSKSVREHLENKAFRSPPYPYWTR